MDEVTAFYLAQGISIITGVLAIILMQFKNMKMILLFQIIVNLLAGVNYLLLGGDTGAIVSVIAIIQSVVMFLYSRKKKAPQRFVIIIFILSYICASVYNIIVKTDPMEILPALAAVCFSASLVQQKPFLFRVWGALNPALWLPYDLYTASYVMFFVHLSILISSVVGMIRIDGIFKRKKNI